MPPINLIVPAYTAQSGNVSAQLCRNRFLQRVEAQGEKNAYCALVTPGSQIYSSIPQRNVPTMIRVKAGGSERVFAASNDTLYEISSGVAAALGTFANGAGTYTPSMAASDSQLLVSANGFLYVLTLADNTWASVASPPSSSLWQVGYCKGSFFAIKQNSAVFFISAVDDASTWDAADFVKVTEIESDIVGHKVDHGQVIFYGDAKSQLYANVGDAQVFEPIDGAIVEDGLAATYSPVRADNSVFWIAADERGQARIVRLSGAIGQRVSTHAIEYKLRQYGTISDAIGLSYELDGHTMVCWYFPTANQPHLCYDCATGLWHEWSYKDPTAGNDIAHRSMCHVFAFGKHLVGDWSSGRIYEINAPTWTGTSWTFCTDSGSPIRRVLRSAHVAQEKSRIEHKELRLDVETGIGPIPALTNPDGTPRGSLLMLRWSDDGAHTWSNERALECGQAGEYKARVNFRRLGMSRDRIYEIADSDAVPLTLAAAYLNPAGS